MNIWFVDDDEIILSLLKSIIGRNCAHSNCKFYSNPNEAYLDFIHAETKPDKIILDLNMPGLSGFQFLELLSVFPSNLLTTEVYMLSSSIREEEHNECLKYHFVKEFLVKPFKMPDFKRIGICIGQQQNLVA